MSFVFRAHSGLRYLVFAMAVVALVVFLVGFLRGRPFGRFPRAIGASYAGLVHLQATLGLVMVVMGKVYPRLVGHAVMMLVAAVSLQVLLSSNLRRPAPGYGRPLAGVVVTMLCFLAGLAAIGRGVLEATAFHPPPPS